jgi:hypothetical protein
MRNFRFIVLLLAALPASTVIAQQWKSYVGYRQDGSTVNYYIDTDSIEQNGVLALVKFRMGSGAERYLEFDCSAKTASVRKLQSPPSSYNPASELGIIAESSILYDIGEYICANSLRRLLM